MLGRNCRSVVVLYRCSSKRWFVEISVEIVVCGDGLGPVVGGLVVAGVARMPCPLTSSRGVVRHGLRPAVPAFAIATGVPVAGIPAHGIAGLGIAGLGVTCGCTASC
ncbi:MAG: hypothetical protein QG671_3624 [Actinomycetota bacterium]|nr:hypothetical protein [Actinomycetota bacterium]